MTTIPTPFDPTNLLHVNALIAKMREIEAEGCKTTKRTKNLRICFWSVTLLLLLISGTAIYLGFYPFKTTGTTGVAAKELDAVASKVAAQVADLDKRLTAEVEKMSKKLADSRVVQKTESLCETTPEKPKAAEAVCQPDNTRIVKPRMVEDVSIDILGQPGSGFQPAKPREKAQIFSFAKAEDPELGTVLIPNARERRGIAVRQGTALPEFQFNENTGEEAKGFKPIAHPSRKDASGRAYVVFVRQ